MFLRHSLLRYVERWAEIMNSWYMPFMANMQRSMSSAHHPLQNLQTVQSGMDKAAKSVGLKEKSTTEKMQDNVKNVGDEMKQTGRNVGH